MNLSHYKVKKMNIMIITLDDNNYSIEITNYVFRSILKNIDNEAVLPMEYVFYISFVGRVLINTYLFIYFFKRLILKNLNQVLLLVHLKTEILTESNQIQIKTAIRPNS